MPSNPAATPTPPQSSSCPRQDRTVVACQLLDREQARRERGATVRSFATETGTPRSTLQDRLHAAQDDGLPTGWQPFFESDVGLHFVLRLLVAVLVIFVVRGGCSAELAAEFFEVMHLRRFVAASPTTLRGLLAPILAHTGAWGDAEFTRLAKDMPRREIVLALDENFHWKQMLLVVMDVASGFLFAEKSSTTRDAATWETTVRESLVGFNVCLRALTRDGGDWLCKCARRLDVPSGHDTFHIQYAVCRATARPMAKRVAQAQKAAQARRDELAQVRAERAKVEAAPREPGRPANWDAREAHATAAVASAEQEVATRQKEREAMQASIRAIGDAHHPVDLRTGTLQSAEAIRERLLEIAQTLCEQAAQASLGMRAIKALNGVFERIDDLVGITVWWTQELRQRLTTLALPPADVAWIEQKLVPAVYVQHRIALGRTEDERDSLRALWERLRAGLVADGSPWRTWDRARRGAVLDLVQSWVLLFPRSTSMLEGHNGQDALCQHQRHQLSDTFRKARLVLRNYVITRADDTTAAERLFGKKPGDLLEYLCARIKLPGRGRFYDRRPSPELLPLAG